MKTELEDLRSLKLDKELYTEERQAVVAAGLCMIRSGITAGTYGNISARLNENAIAITPSGKEYEQLTAADIVITDTEGNQTAGTLLPSSELPMHLEIYKHFPKAGAVIHTHSIYASALAAAHKDLPPVMEDLTQVVGGPVYCTEYTIAGTKKLGEKAVEAMNGRPAALLANHGAVCWGRDLKEALYTAQLLEKGAKIYYLARSFGTPFPLEDKIVRQLHEFYLEHYRKRQRGEEEHG